jgi:type II secretory pathway component PulF
MENFLTAWGPIILLIIVWIFFMSRYRLQKTKSDETIEKVVLLLEEMNKLLKDIHTEMKKRS